MSKKYKLLCLVIVLVLALTANFTLAACDNGYTDWDFVKEPTCTEEGEMRRHKIRDESDVETKPIPALGHLWGENDGWQVITEPTHQSEGVKRRECKRCGYEEIEAIDILTAAYHIDIKDGDKLIERVYVEEDGVYELTLPQKLGYTCDKLLDSADNEFELQGTINENKVLQVSWKILPTNTFDELAERAAAGIDRIWINDDIVITDSVYIVGKTEIYVEKDCTISRSSDFAGDMFVIGENAQGESTLLSGKGNAELTLKAKNGAAFVFDGNKDNVTKEVNGTCFLVVYSAIVNMYDGITVQNFRKTANSKIVESAYAVSYPQKIGGAAMIVVNGTFNMYGGSFTNNSVNTDETFDGDDSESDSARVSSCGGAIYNFTAVNVYNGSFENNEAARGGAIYNYRTARIYGGTFKNNTASVYAGAIYLPGSQYAALYLGNAENSVTENDAKILFEGNGADKSGGAIFGQMKNSINIYGNTTFKSNTATGYNGGAINTSGALVIVDALFQNNVAASKGGAIYAYYSKDDLTPRQVDIQGGTFVSNRASKGGAIAFSTLDEEFDGGSVGFIGSVVFSNNEAFATSGADPELPDADNESTSAASIAEGETTESKNYNGNGGAIYIARKSAVVIEGSASFIENNAERNGGAIYVTGEAQLTVAPSVGASVTFRQNTASINGGAIYVHGEKTTFVLGNWTVDTQADEDDTEKTFIATFDSNRSGEKGGAIYVTNGSVEEGATVANPVDVKIDNAKFLSNSSDGNGGAIYCYTQAQLTVKNSNFSTNQTTSTAQGGGAVYLTAATANITDCTFEGNKAVNMNGGAIGAYSGATLNIANSIFDGNSTQNASANGGGALYLSRAVVTVSNSTFKNNTSAKNGAAVGVYSQADVTFNGTTVFNSNAATGNGGAIYLASGGGTKVTVNGTSSFTNNSAVTGGAIYVTSDGSILTVNGNSTFTGNAASSQGGAVYVTGPSTVAFENVVATSNSANEGGFLYLTKTNTSVTIKAGSANNNTANDNSIIKGNASKAVLNIKGTADNTEFKIDGQNVTKDGTIVAGSLKLQYFTED